MVREEFSNDCATEMGTASLMNTTHFNQNAEQFRKAGHLSWPSCSKKEGALTGERTRKAESDGGTGTPQQKCSVARTGTRLSGARCSDEERVGAVAIYQRILLV